MKIIPAKEVVILRDLGTQKTKSGLYLPDEDGREKPEIGIVEEIGHGELPVGFKKGDRVIFKKYMRSDIEVGSESFNIVAFKDILGVIQDVEISTNKNQK